MSAADTETSMPPSSARQISMTIIVATTPSLGIGFKNSLPWPQLKAEMAYFARVTKRIPRNIQQTTPDSSPFSIVNAVLMGRSTYESIPRKFRPLKDRLNIVLTRAPAGSEARAKIEKEAKDGTVEGPLVVGSIAEALSVLSKRGIDNDKSFGETSNEDSQRDARIGRVFVIGGAEVYAQALKMPECDRVLRTRIENEFECDVFFPVKLDEDPEWSKASNKELNHWVEEDVPTGTQEQNDIRWEYEMWERKTLSN